MSMTTILKVGFINALYWILSMAIPVVMAAIVLLSASWYTGVGFEHGIRPVAMALSERLKGMISPLWYKP